MSPSPTEALLVEYDPRPIILDMTPGPQGPPGPKGEDGEAGPKGDPGLSGPDTVAYVHIQSEPSAVWTITHELGFHPSVTVVDTAGTVVEGEEQYVDSSTIVINFAFPFGGKAYLS